MTKTKLKTTKMKETISFVAHQDHAQQKPMKNGYRKNIVTSKFFISWVQELKILIIILSQTSKTNQII